MPWRSWLPLGFITATDFFHLRIPSRFAITSWPLRFFTTVRRWSDCYLTVLSALPSLARLGICPRPHVRKVPASNILTWLSQHFVRKWVWLAKSLEPFIFSDIYSLNVSFWRIDWHKRFTLWLMLQGCRALKGHFMILRTFNFMNDIKKSRDSFYDGIIRWVRSDSILMIIRWRWAWFF
jgi:hypothetical protein